MFRPNEHFVHAFVTPLREKAKESPIQEKNGLVRSANFTGHRIQHFPSPVEVCRAGLLVTHYIGIRSPIGGGARKSAGKEVKPR